MQLSRSRQGSKEGPFPGAGTAKEPLFSEAVWESDLAAVSEGEPALAKGSPSVFPTPVAIRPRSFAIAAQVQQESLGAPGLWPTVSSRRFVRS